MMKEATIIKIKERMKRNKELPCLARLWASLSMSARKRNEGNSSLHFATLGLKMTHNANTELFKQILVLKILVNAHNLIVNKVVRACSKIADWFLCFTEKASRCWGQERNHQTENGPASSIQEGFSESWTTAVPPMKRSWCYTFLPSRKGTTLLTELIHYFWAAPNLASNLPHPSYQAAPNPSQVTTEMWTHKRSLFVEPRRQKEKSDKPNFTSRKTSQHVSIND